MKISARMFFPTILYHTYGEEVFCWMMTDGIKDARDTMCDEAANHPISVEEQMVNDAMNKECPSWAMFQIENVALIKNDKQKNKMGVA